MAASTSLNSVDNIWSDLQKELLDLILQCLPVVDHIRFGAVCTSWWSVMIDRAPPCPRQLPWLIAGFPSGNNASDTIMSCWSIPENHTYKLDIIPKGLCSAGGNYGWLVMTSGDYSNFCLLNPVSKIRVDLPSYLDATRMHPPKVVLSSSPSSSCCMVAVVSYGSTSAVACRVGDHDWTKIELLPSKARDLTFHKGQLYILRWEWDLEICSFDCLHGCITRLHTVPLPPSIQLNMRTHLVSMGEELLLFHVNGPFHKKPKFYLFKFDEDGLKWVRIHSLGNQTMFVGWRHSVSLSVVELVVSALEKNSVYYNTDCEIWRISVENEERELVQSSYLPCWYMPGL